MRESGYYPPGAEFDPNAPYNQVEPEERESKVSATYCTRRTDEIWSSKYDEDENLLDPQREWESLYMTPLELFRHCRKLAEEALENVNSKYQDFVLRKIIEDCEGWEDVEQEIDQL